MIEEEWDYIGEGKVHIAVCNMNTCSVYFGYALLITKGTKLLPAEDRTKFMSSVMNILMSSNYVSDKSLEVELPAQFVDDLLRRIQPLRPSKRVSANTKLDRSALLVRNFGIIYRAIPPFFRAQKSSLTIEFKVKGGDEGSSPFITDKRVIKLHHSRFQLIQLYKTASLVSCVAGTQAATEWGNIRKFSTYEPRNLCSGDFMKVRQSLDFLLDNPQNNLRVTLNTKHIYGWDLSAIDVLKRSLAGSDFGGCCEDCAVDRVLLVVAAVLCEEDVLQRLQSAQRLDLLDVEGAALAFNRLCDLFGVQQPSQAMQQSCSVVTDYLAAQLTQPIDPRVLDSIHNARCNLKADVVSSACAEYTTNSVELVHRLAMLSVNADMSTDQRPARRGAAIALLNACSAEQCALLLQLWMASLVAKDASVLVTLQACAPVTVPQQQQQPQHEAERRGCYSGTHGTVRVTKQTDSTCGTVTESKSVLEQIGGAAATSPAPEPSSSPCCSCSSCPLHCAYSVGVIDLGMKALDKAWRKDAEEDEVCALAARTAAILHL